MIVIYTNGTGTAEKLSPEHVYQGSNQSGVLVFAPIPPQTAMGIAFKLPDGTSTPYYPMTYQGNYEGLSQYEFTLPSSLTQLAGQASIALQALYSDGQQTSQLIEFEIEKSIVPEPPTKPTPDAYDLLKQAIAKNTSDISSIQGQIDNIESLAESANSKSDSAVDTANQAKATADGLAGSIAQANTTAQQAVDTANGAVEDIAKYKSDTDSDIAQFKQTVNEEITQFESATDEKIESFENTVNNDLAEYKSQIDGQVAEIDSKSDSAVSTANQAKTTADDLADSIAQANATADEAKTIAEEALEQSKVTGTKVNVNGEFQTELSFDSDPQTQLDNKVNKNGDTMTGDLQLDKALLSKNGDNPIFVLPFVPFSEIDPTHDTVTYLKALLKWICQNYPNVTGGTWIGRAQPNSMGICMLSIYDTNDVNTEGLPRYSDGHYGDISANAYHFGTNDFGYIYKESVNKSGATMTGELVNMFGQRLRGYKDVPTSNNLVNERSGFFGGAFEVYSKYIVSGEGGDKFCVGWEFLDNLIHTKVYNSGNSQVDGTIPFIETSKLKPTTANGWTVGDATLKMNKTGVFLVAVARNGEDINIGVPGIMILRDDTVLGIHNFNGVCLTNDNHTLMGNPCFIEYRGTISDNNGASSGAWKLRKVTGTTETTEPKAVAYKQIA